MQYIAPFVGLTLGLAALLWSTRQFSLPTRGAIWAIGVGLLVISVALAVGGAERIGALALLVQSPSLFGLAFRANSAVIGDAFGPLFDAFLLLAILIALVTLAAFTRGTLIERTVRPVSIALIGAIGGALLALAIAGVGFGGMAKRRVFIDRVEPFEVVDGDTIMMGDVSLRLWGIDAPELDQACRNADGSRRDCGVEAKTHLEEIIAGRVVVCNAPPKQCGATEFELGKPPTESFGRPILSCTVLATGEDLAERMATDGFADVYVDSKGVAQTCYGDPVFAAKYERKGVWSGYTVSPGEWRTNSACRYYFQNAATSTLVAQGSPVFACPMPE